MSVFHSLLGKLAAWVVAGATAISLIFSPVSNQPQNFGAALPQQGALYDSYLSAGISATDVAMTLANGSWRNGQALSGYICFVIDNNSPSTEFTCGTASGTSVTGLARGIDITNPTATSSALAYSHRRLASVQVTDYPFNQLVQRKLNGTDSFDSVLSYTSATSTFITAANQIPNKAYVDSVAISGGTLWLPSGNNIYNTNSGFVGIGTASPTSSLYIVPSSPSSYGSLTVQGTGVTATTTASIWLASADNSILRFTEQFPTNGQQGFALLYDGANSNNLFKILRHNAADSASSSDIAALTIQRANGAIGIATTTPAATLHVDGSMIVTGSSTFSGVAASFSNLPTTTTTAPTASNQLVPKGYLGLSSYGNETYSYSSRNTSSTSSGISITTDGTQQIVVNYTGNCTYPSSDTQTHTNTVSVLIDGVSQTSYIPWNALQPDGVMGFGSSLAYMSTTTSAATHTVKYKFQDVTTGSVNVTCSVLGYAYALKFTQ